MTPRDGILILDSESATVIEVNPFLTQLLGYRREELVGKPFLDIGFLTDQLHGASILDKVRLEGYARCGDLPFRTSDGSLIFAEVVGNSYFVDDRSVIQLNIGDVKDRSAGEKTSEGAPADPHPGEPPGNGAQRETRTLLRTITAHARVLLNADAGELFLYRPERDLLERAIGAGSSCSRLGLHLRRGEGMAGKVWEAGERVLLHKHPGEPSCGGSRKELSCRWALGTPIRWRDEFLGVLGVVSRREKSFSDADTQVLELLAGQAAMAIVISRLASDLERLAVVDELTGVLNRRGLLTLGRREVERARRLGRPLAMLFVDLDHFKALNDEFSHEVGDEALREVGRAIHDSMRRIDMVARYGGEEFVALLVETELGPAVEVGERVRQAVEATSLATDRGPVRVTVSVGVTARGPDASDLEALIHRADEAMYAAKQAGRNRVVAL